MAPPLWDECWDLIGLSDPPRENDKGKDQKKEDKDEWTKEDDNDQTKEDNKYWVKKDNRVVSSPDEKIYLVAITITR